MKKRMMILCLAVLLVGTTVIGGTFAGFNTETEQQATAQITTKSLSVNLIDTTIEDMQTPLAGSIETIGEEDAIMPGDVIPVSRSIQNDAEYDLYTRATIYKRWDKDALDASKIQLVLGNEEDWIVWHQDDEQVILYYRNPLKGISENGATDVTSEMISAVSVSGDIDNQYTGANIILEFEVDAVQMLAADAAIPAEWGVYPTFDEEGRLKSVSE
ncbi:MAG: hypothetical protein IJZ82_00445 [Lachnospiraceae bacterium]|nr:hypothetical protein [Lachnospiraceae bacterium]